MKIAIDQIANNVSVALERYLGVKGRSLLLQLRRAGRRLPADIRADIELIVEAQAFYLSPKMIHRINLPRLEAAERRVLAYLRHLDPVTARRSMMLAMVMSIAVNVLLVSGVLLAILIWQGVI